MLQNYLRVALRNIIRHKGYASVNIAGLALGMASVILILIYVQNELSYDSYGERSRNIFRVIGERRTKDGTKFDAVTPPPLAPALSSDYSSITTAVRLLNMDNPLPMIKPQSSTVSYYEKKLFFADPGMFKIFIAKFIEGNPETSLKNPNSVVITEKTAFKYFGEENAFGKILRLNNAIDLQITGVIKDYPFNSSVSPEILVSFSTLDGWLGKNFTENWQNNTCETYILVNGNTGALAGSMKDFIVRHFEKSNPLKNLALQPLSRIHLYSREDYKISSGGDIRYIYILSAIAMFILLISCFNYVSLTTAQFIKRIKEAGIRKLLGATRRQLFSQYLSEGFILTFTGLIAALIIAAVILSKFKTITGSDIAFGEGSLTRMILLPSVFTLLAGFLSGIYPALYLSSFNASGAVKGISKISRTSIRRGLIIVQFALTNLLIVGSCVVYSQLHYMEEKDLGLDADRVIIVPIRDEGMRVNQEPVKARLMESPFIQNVGAASLLPAGPVGNTRYKVEGQPEVNTMPILWVNYDFIKAMGISLAAGRDFSKDYATDSSEAYIINEEASESFGFKKPADAVGKSFEILGSKKGNIIGVVKNFHYKSLQNRIEPLVIRIWPWLNYLVVKVKDKNIEPALGAIRSALIEFDKDHPFDFSFLNENFGKFYGKERTLEKTALSFTGVAIFIACMGLFSLSAFTSGQRKKETGIRKVLGASASSIASLQFKQYLIMVAVAIFISVPASFYFMSDWLRSYAYRIELSVWFFICAGVISTVSALLAVGYHAIKSSRANPIEALRYE
jgi:putative ABC transport system permease protein